MILTEVFANVEDINDLEQYHIETCMVKSDDLMKRILRVTSDHGNDYGIRLAEDSEGLENGSAFKIGHHRLLVLSVIPDEIIKIVPKDIDEMGVLAHMPVICINQFKSKLERSLCCLILLWLRL